MRLFNRRPAKRLGFDPKAFARAFGVGETDQDVNPVDAFGVALTAVQGLHQIAQEQEARIAALEARLAALERKPTP